MLSKVNTCVLAGLEGIRVEVETDITRGIPVFNIVGLADTAIKESKERVRSAINNSGFKFPISRITINLSPASTRKEGSHLDLPIAIGILTSMGVIKSATEKTAFLGELSLDGRLNSIKGALPMGIHIREAGFKEIIVPGGNKEEVGLVEGIKVTPAESLEEVLNHLDKKKSIEPHKTLVELDGDSYKYDFKDMRGQASAKRAVEVAVSGFHNIIMIGPRGSGKTMFARRIPSIMPKLSFEEALDITRVYSVLDAELESGIIRERPFRAPHHTTSSASLCGGGASPMPGEVSLAHRGILFLDELPEFQRGALESLRQPLEDREVTISRVNGKVSYPSDILLVASMNPCNCGNYGTDMICKCSQTSIDRYLSKLSAPLLDRIDIHIEVDRVSYSDISSEVEGEDSTSIRQRVEKAREIQSQRYRGEEILFNSQIDRSNIDKYCKLDRECRGFMENTFKELNLSARAHDRIIKIARTIADLDGLEDIGLSHLAEAVQYRSLDRKYWL